VNAGPESAICFAFDAVAVKDALDEAQDIVKVLEANPTATRDVRVRCAGDLLHALSGFAFCFVQQIP